MPITRVEAIRKFFGQTRPVESKEIMELAKADRQGYIELAEAAAKELGETIIQP